VKNVEAAGYIKFVEQGPCNKEDFLQIQRDIPRTFKTGNEENIFTQLVPESSLYRVLSAFINSIDDSSVLCYVQGLNVICGSFLFVMPEVDSFYCLQKFIYHYCQSYFSAQTPGAHEGVEIISQCLRATDLELHNFFEEFAQQKKNVIRNSQFFKSIYIQKCTKLH